VRGVIPHGQPHAPPRDRLLHLLHERRLHLRLLHLLHVVVHLLHVRRLRLAVHLQHHSWKRGGGVVGAAGRQRGRRLLLPP
jgi:hypothetical protein